MSEESEDGGVVVTDITGETPKEEPKAETPPAEEPKAEDKPDDKGDAKAGDKGDNKGLMANAKKDEWEDLDFTSGEKPESLDDKYWDAENGVPNVNAILKDKAIADKRAENSRKAIGDKGNEEGGKAPESVEGYTFEEPEGYEVKNADPLVSAVKEKALEKGVSAEAFNSVMSVAYEAMAEAVAGGTLNRTAEQIEADQDAYREAEIEKLGVNGQAVVNAVSEWIDSMANQGKLTPEAAEALKATGRNAEEMQAFNMLRVAMGGDPQIVASIGDKSVEATRSELQKLHTSEEFKRGDPETIAKAEAIVEELRKRGVV